MEIHAIVACDCNGVIGFEDGSLPWHYPEDMKHFKSLTVGNVIIMGRKTFESIGKALPYRYNIVISSDPTLQEKNNEILVVPTPEAAILLAIKVVNRGAYKDIFIVGGATIYDQLYDYCKKIYLTKIEVPVPVSDNTVKLSDRICIKLSSYLKAARTTAADYTFYDGIQL